MFALMSTTGGSCQDETPALGAVTDAMDGLEVGLVSERRVGRQRMYRVNPERLKPIYDWVQPFERFWSDRFNRLDEVLKEIQKKEK
jgi:hypothetical protein